MRSSIRVCLLALCVGCGGPILMMPGGELSGHVQPVPDDWAFSNDIENIQLETRPEDPYSVNLWGVGVGSDFYVASGRGLDSAWARYIEEDPNVRLRIGDHVYPLRAVRIRDATNRERFLAAARLKYADFTPTEEEAEKAILFRLEAR